MAGLVTAWRAAPVSLRRISSPSRFRTHREVPLSDTAAPDPAVPPDKPAEKQERPVLPDRSTDETDVGWGDRPEPDDQDRLRQDRPPHWDDY
jgi:hypothetical protein